nr:MFS transporter [Shigella flexneri]
MGSGSVSLFLMIAFYALSGFFQSTGGSCSYSTITKWTPRRKRGTFLGFWNISHNLGGAGAAGVALFGANYLFDGHVIGMFIFPSIIALIVVLSACVTAATPRNLMASAKLKNCSRGDQRRGQRDRIYRYDQVADLC